jgi:YfiH family protein
VNAPVIVIPRLAAIPWLVHGFGTRRFNLADLRAEAARHRAEAVLLDQVHSGIVRVVETLPARRLAGDALATQTPGLVLAVKTADYLPILLVDEERRAVAAVHAGWRGAALAIAGHAVTTLRRNFGTNPANLLAALGPSIGPPCYEVGEEVRRRFAETGLAGEFFRPRRGRPGKYLFDLAAANIARLEAAGVPRSNILSVGRCTYCDPDFHSYRRDGDTRRRLYNYIGIVG